MPLPNSGAIASEPSALSRDEIEVIRSRHPIEQVVAQYAQLRPTGRLLQARCPLPGHEDKVPSFTVYPATQSCYCFGCNRGGDVFKFIQLVEQVGFREAVAKLEGHVCSRPAKSMAQPVREMASVPRPVNEDALALLTAGAEVYHASLMLNTAMLQYLTGRGIALDTIQWFRLGYATGDNLTKYFRFRGWDVELGKELGLIGERGEFFRQRITIPEWRAGKVVYLTGRQTTKHQRVKYLGLPGVPKPLYGLEGVKGSPEVFVVEGNFDLLTMEQWGYPAVALLGSHLKKEWVDELRFVERLYIVTDSDEPGRASAQVLAENFGQRAVIVPPLSNAKDVNDLARQPNGRELFGHLVAQAKAMAQMSGSDLAQHAVPDGR